MTPLTATNYTEVLSQEISTLNNSLNNESNPETAEHSIKDFQRIATIGVGSFGAVILMKHKPSDQMMAVKVLKKTRIVRLKQEQHTMNEGKILSLVDSPFIVKMHFKFKDNANLYMVFEFIGGGELFSLVRRDVKLKEETVRFYGGQMLLVLEYLHGQNIIYRDLKPENILIDKNGYLKIVDFGFAKYIDSYTYTLCGTPEYLAPEIIKGKGYNLFVDWWAFGILLFELVTGNPPFMHSSQKRLYEMILEGHLQIPYYVSIHLTILLKHLITADITHRYGALKDGSNDIRDSRWFSLLDFDKLSEQTIPPPFIPAELSKVDDHSNFDKYDEVVIEDSICDLYSDVFKDF